MRTQITPEEAIGRRIEGIFFSTNNAQAVITVSGKAFVCLVAKRGYDQDDEIETDKLQIFDFGDDAIVESGIATKEELEAMRKAEAEDFIKRREGRPT